MVAWQHSTQISDVAGRVVKAGSSLPVFFRDKQDLVLNHYGFIQLLPNVKVKHQRFNLNCYLINLVELIMR